MMIFHYSIINTCKGMKKRALCPLSGVHLTIKPIFYYLFYIYKVFYSTDKQPIGVAYNFAISLPLNH